jgi:hypothetical protein
VWLRPASTSGLRGLSVRSEREEDGEINVPITQLRRSFASPQRSACWSACIVVEIVPTASLDDPQPINERRSWIQLSRPIRFQSPSSIFISLQVLQRHVHLAGKRTFCCARPSGLSVMASHVGSWVCSRFGQRTSNVIWGEGGRLRWARCD